MRITLKDIAKAANVSVSTVSLALRNDPRIKASRREMIRKLAEEMGYMPNPLLSSLASRQFRKSENFEGLGIAFFTYLPLLNNAKPNYPYVTAYMEGLKPHAEKLGYRMEHFELSSQRSLPALGRMLYQRGFGGIVIGPVRNVSSSLDFPWEQFCVVACGGVEPRIARNFHWIKTDFFGVTRRSYQRAWDAGYRRIGVVLAEQTGELEETDLRLGAVLTVGRLLHPDTKPLVYSLQNDQHCQPNTPVRKKFLQWVKKHQPDCIIGYSLEFYYALKDDGYRVPEEIGYLSLHIRPRDKWYDPLSGYCVNQMKLGRAAVEQVDSQIHYGIRGYAHEPRVISLLPDWMERESLPPRTTSTR